MARGAELNEETFNMLKDNQKQELLKNFRRIIKESLKDNEQLLIKINKLKNKIEVNEKNHGEHSQDRYLKVLLVLDSSTEYKYSDYMKMYGFIDANKKSKSPQKKQPR